MITLKKKPIIQTLIFFVATSVALGDNDIQVLKYVLLPNTKNQIGKFPTKDLSKISTFLNWPGITSFTISKDGIECIAQKSFSTKQITYDSSDSISLDTKFDFIKKLKSITQGSSRKDLDSIIITRDVRVSVPEQGSPSVFFIVNPPEPYLEGYLCIVKTTDQFFNEHKGLFSVNSNNKDTAKIEAL
jgi:hypothetical protein